MQGCVLQGGNYNCTYNARLRPARQISIYMERDTARCVLFLYPHIFVHARAHLYAQSKQTAGEALHRRRSLAVFEHTPTHSTFTKLVSMTPRALSHCLRLFSSVTFFVLPSYWNCLSVHSVTHGLAPTGMNKRQAERSFAFTE